jgi:hypothetical protein
MCGKFTALASWSEVVAFSQPLTESGGGEGPSGDDGSNDEIVTYRVGGLLPVIVWDAETHARRVVKMLQPSPKISTRPNSCFFPESKSCSPSGSPSIAASGRGQPDARASARVRTPRR